MNAPLLQRLLSARMLIAFAMGFASGLPLLLTGSVLQAWMAESQVSLKTLAFYTALVGLPYTFKFVWAPVFDRYVLPLGRRRGWLVVTQLLLVVAIGALAVSDPKNQLAGVAIASLLVTFFSASQDIVIDAYRRESLADDELGFGSAMAVNGYRIGMLVASGGGLALADQIGFRSMYFVMAIIMAVGIVVTLLAPEPAKSIAAPRSLRAAVVEPFVEYLQRHGAWLTLLFILLYKLGDTLASAITTPFYLSLGFTKTEIAAVVKLWGLWATIIGGTLGGVLILKIGLARALFLFGIGQMLSTAGFVWLAQVGHSIPALAAVIAFENFTGGMGTAAFVGFMGALTDRRFTATQYALLTSLMGVPRVILSAGTGAMATSLGWSNFFLFCTLIAIPGLFMARRAAQWLNDSEPRR
jgi:MFS transporter, PAT family, beta-lactamase induction signal transducer AmpG